MGGDVCQTIVDDARTPDRENTFCTWGLSQYTISKRGVATYRLDQSHLYVLLNSLSWASTTSWRESCSSSVIRLSRSIVSSTVSGSIAKAYSL